MPHPTREVPLDDADKLLLQIAEAGDEARVWTRCRDARIREAVNAGMSLRAAADAAGLSHTAVAKIAKRRG